MASTERPPRSKKVAVDPAPGHPRHLGEQLAQEFLAGRGQRLVRERGEALEGLLYVTDAFRVHQRFTVHLRMPARINAPASASHALTLAARKGHRTSPVARSDMPSLIRAPPPLLSWFVHDAGGTASAGP